MLDRPSRVVTTQEIETYRQDGVVCLRQAIAPLWVARLRTAWARLRAGIEAGQPQYRLPPEFLERDPRLAAEIAAANSAERAAGQVARKFYSCKWMWHWDPDFRDFALNSGAGEVVGRVMEADQIRWYWDQMFVKDAGCPINTYWHADYPAWPITGEMLPSLWIALSPIGKDSCVETVAGTHRDTTLQWPRSFNARSVPWPKDTRPDFIDYEQRRDDPSLRILSFDMEPGDAILIHPRVHHGGGDNPDPTRDRIAITTRWIGNDIRWDPRPECVNTPGLPLSEMTPGGRPGDRPGDEAVFPVVWTRPGSERRSAAA